jgi:hypothetical protein
MHTRRCWTRRIVAVGLVAGLLNLGAGIARGEELSEGSAVEEL